MESLLPLPDQDYSPESVHNTVLDVLSVSEIAQGLFLHHWTLFNNTHEYEYLYNTIGRGKFPGRITTNLDLLSRRFNEVQFWAITEILSCQSLSKRASFVKKFIKLAAQARLLQDLLTFFSIVFGLSNTAISRLTSTWDRVPAKARKLFLDLESLLDPCKNHRAYRMLAAKMKPPVIPFIPLILKDLTFTHEGNKTFYDSLVNFEKMRVTAQTLRMLRSYKSEQPTSEFPLMNPRIAPEANHLVKNFQVIDDQKRLAALSHTLESRKDT